MIITPKNKKSIYEIIEEDEDLMNLIDGNYYYRIWNEGKFQTNIIPQKETDGSIILPADSHIETLHIIETNVNIELENEEEWDKFWKTHTVSHFIIRDGFDIDEDL